MSRITTLYHPARFQSHPKRDGWFEGWYFKLVDADGRHPVAVIPGVSRDEAGGTTHAFVQTIRAGGTARYHRFDFDAFTWTDDRFSISVGPNRFDEAGLHLEIEGDLTGDVRFGAWTPWPVRMLSPGIMGWYRFVPRMECYHGVLSLDHTLHGGLSDSDGPLDFSGGRGYAEKDWGTGFPSSWVWAQSNRFTDDQGRNRPGVSLTASVAKIPWLGSSFVGHIAGVLLDTGELVRFTTYTGSRLEAVETDAGSARVVVADRRHRLEIRLSGAQTGTLKAPSLGAMTGRADEALDATVEVLLTDVGGRTRFSGIGTCAGVEIMNERDELHPD